MNLLIKNPNAAMLSSSSILRKLPVSMATAKILENHQKSNISVFSEAIYIMLGSKTMV
jgi:hypothetical protein